MKKAIRWVLQIALSGLMFYAGWIKLRDPGSFAESVASFQLLPNGFIVPITLTFPPLEMLAAILALTTGFARRAGAFCLLVLLAVFLLALGSAVARGITVDCGCFGTDRFDVVTSSKNLWRAIGRDLVLFAVAAWLVGCARQIAGYSHPVHPAATVN